MTDSATGQGLSDEKNITTLHSDTFIGKRFTLKDGEIRKKSNTTFSSGRAKSAYAPDAKALKSLIEGLGENTNLCLGVMPGRDEAKVVTEPVYRELKDKTGTIARTTDHLVHPDSAGWLLIDFDDDAMPEAVAERIDALGGVPGALRHIWPELSDAEMLVRGSSSNGVYADGVDPQASAGLHVYVLIEDPANTVKALDALQRRAWAAGLGWIKPSKSGAALVRSIVDASVGTSNRIAFEAPPKLGEGVYRLPDEIKTQTGQALDAPVDGPDVDDLIAAEKVRMRPILEKIQREYIRERGQEVARKTKVSIAEGQKIVRDYLAQDGGQIDVPHGMLVYDRNGAVVTAEALVRSVRHGDQFGLPDPIEGPSYGRTTATLFWGHKYDAPILISHAHGAKTIYRLPAPPSKAIWKIKPAAPKNRKRAKLIEVLSKVASQDDLDKVLGVAVALSNKVPAVLSGRDAMAFIADHLPDGVIGDDWLKAIEGRIRWTLNKRRKQALAPTRFSADMLGKAWVSHTVVDELSPLDQIDGVTVVRAPMASGKTQRVGAPWIRAAKQQGKEVMAIAHRVSLVSELAQRLEMTSYQGGFRPWVDDEAETLAICLPSITLDRWVWCKPDYVMIDEIRQVLEFLGAEMYCRTKNGTAADVFDRLVKIVRDAKGVLCADAGCDDTVLRFLRMCRPDDQIRVVEMKDNPTEIKGTFMTGEHCQDDVAAQAAFAMRQGSNIWFACEGAEKAAAVAHDLGKLPGKQVLLLNAENKLDEAQKAFLDDPEGQSRKYDAVVASPIISSGISIEKPHFHAGFALFSGGAIRPADAAQMLRRVRYLKDWTIGLTSLNRFGGSRAEDIIEGRVAAADLEGACIDPSDFDELVIGFKAEAHNLRGDFAAGLWWLLKDAGWTLSRHTVEEKEQGYISEVQEGVRRERDGCVIDASHWLTKAAERWGEVRVAKALEDARKDAPAARTRRRIDAWAIMDTIGLRKLEQEDLDWWRDGGRATATRYEDLICRTEPIDVDHVTLAHRALRLARRKHFAEMWGDWNPVADDAVLSEEVAERALSIIWPRRKEFAASGAVPEDWRNDRKAKPKNARAAVRQILSRCGLRFERKQIRCHRFCQSEYNGEHKSGDRVWRWITGHDHLAQIRDRHAQIQDRNAQRQRALVVSSEQADQAAIQTLKAGLDAIEARRRADHAANEAAKALDRIVKSGRTPPPIMIYRAAPPEILPSGVTAEDLFAALRRRGVPACLIEP